MFSIEGTEIDSIFKRLAEILTKRDGCTKNSKLSSETQNLIMSSLNKYRAADGIAKTLNWDSQLASKAEDIIDSCQWIGKKSSGCDGSDVGVISYYKGLMSGSAPKEWITSASNVEGLLSYWYEDSKVAYAAGKAATSRSQGDDDAVGRSYAYLGNPDVTKIACSVPDNDCSSAGFICVFDRYVEY